MHFITFALLLIIAAVTYADKPHYDLNDAPALFEKFIKDYNRHYKDDADRHRHYEAFVKSLEVINRSNEESQGAVDATFNINNFADYTEEEQKTMYGLLIPTQIQPDVRH